MNDFVMVAAVPATWFGMWFGYIRVSAYVEYRAWKRR